MQNSAIDYQQLENQKNLEIQQELTKKLSQKDWGRHDSIRHIVLRRVVSAEYEEAIQDLESYIASQSNFPSFQSKCQPYVKHCVELAYAIRTKRNFTGISSMSLSKQQEIYEKVVDHFEDLKRFLKQIEKIERDVRLVDIRSTVWVLQALWQSCLAILSVAFFLEIYSGLHKSFILVVNTAVDNATAALLRLLGL